MSTPSGASSLEFPLEILEEIVGHVERSPDLAACARVSKALHKTAIPLLYRRLIIPYSDQKQGILQILDPEAIKAYSRFFEYNRRGDPKTHSTPHPSDTARITLLSRFQYVTHLTIESHSVGFCAVTSPIIMPALITLRVLPGSRTSTLALCLQDEDEDRETCPIVEHLRPRHLILGGPHETGFTGPATGLWSTESSFPPQWIKSIVLYIGYWPDVEFETSICNLPSTLERFTMVFKPINGDKWDREEPWASEGWVDPQAMFGQVVGLCDGDCGVVEVVGLEGIDETWRGNMSVEEMEKAIRVELAQNLMDREDEAEEVVRKLFAVKFLSRNEFAQREARREVRLH